MSPAIAASDITTVVPFLLLTMWLCGCAAMLAIWVIGWRLAFILSAVPALLVVVIRRQMPESDVWLVDQTRDPSIAAGHRYWRGLSLMLGPALR